MADWTCKANDALTISLVSFSDNSEHRHTFHPAFTYPIYGEEEIIYGYKDLVIDLKLASGSLVQYLNISFSGNLSSPSIADDVEGILRNYIPSGYYKDETAFSKFVEEDAVKFRPFGNLLCSYTRHLSSENGNRVGSSNVNVETEDQTFEVYHVNWDTPGFKEYHRRMQLFILLYIEGGSYIAEEEDSWEFFILYQKRRRRTVPEMASYHFIGYSSLYPFYCFPEQTRIRLSQFVILPPYQHKGHGSELYKAVYHYILTKPNIAELTVEDPAEAFEDLRDRNDLRMLLANHDFMKEGFGETSVTHSGGRVGGVGRKRSGAITPRGKGMMGPPTDKIWSENWRKKLKIAGRQFQRLVEMLILRHLDVSDARGNRAYRLQVKERLYRFNFESLLQLEKDERLQKLQETFQSVCEDYLRILRMMEKEKVG